MYRYSIVKSATGKGRKVVEMGTMKKTVSGPYYVTKQNLFSTGIKGKGVKLANKNP